MSYPLISSLSVSESPMRITAVETTVVNAELRNWILVKVRTDQDGLYGWGEASLNWKTRAVIGAIEDLTPMVVGRDPRDIEQIVRILTKHSYYRLGIIGATAISGIEHALWDIFGKSVGQPVWRLLGGQVRDAVHVYTHLGLGDMRSVYDTSDTGLVREKAAAVVEQGYDALKVVFIPYGAHLTVAAQRRHVDKLMSTLRDTVGPDVDIMVDFHGRPASITAAIQYIDVLAPYQPLFCEEPVQPGTPKRCGMLPSARRYQSPQASDSWGYGNSYPSWRPRQSTSPSPISTTPAVCSRASASRPWPTPRWSGWRRTTPTAPSRAQRLCTSLSAHPTL